MTERFEYSFVRLPVKGGFLRGGFSEAYQDVIREHAREGWRFVQAYAPAVAGYGASRKVDLIFERPLVR